MRPHEVRSAKKDLAGIVNGKDSFTFRTAETAGFQRLEFLGADGTGKNFGEKGHRFRGGACPEEIDGIVQVILYVKKLGEPKELENLVNLGLNFKEYQIPAARFHRLKESCKRSNPGGGNIVKSPALEDQPDKPRFNGLLNPFLEIIGIIGIYVPGEIKNETAFYFIDFLKFDFKALVLFIIKSINYIVVCHDASFAHNLQ